jgi:hypothetical protein
MNPDQKEIEQLAYRLWQERGSPMGSPAEDWARAEAQLRRAAAANEARIYAFFMGPHA